jgi:hypothetical protein
MVTVMELRTLSSVNVSKGAEFHNGLCCSLKAGSSLLRPGFFVSAQLLVILYLVAFRRSRHEPVAGRSFPVGHPQE